MKLQMKIMINKMKYNDIKAHTSLTELSTLCVDKLTYAE